MLLLSRIVGFAAGYFLLLLFRVYGLPMDRVTALYTGIVACWTFGLLVSEFAYRFLAKIEIKRLPIRLVERE